MKANRFVSLSHLH